MTEILLDENLCIVDKIMSKVNICCVEVDQTSSDIVNTGLDKVFTMVKTDRVRFEDNGSLDKIHSSQFNSAQLTQIVEIISKLPISAKIYTHYFMNRDLGDKDAKIIAMRRSLSSIKHNHRNNATKFVIEHSKDYVGSSLQNMLSDEESYYHRLLLPDLFLSVYSRYLGCEQVSKSRSKSQPSDVFYKLLKSKIRLQAFIINGKDIYLEKGDRI